LDKSVFIISLFIRLFFYYIKTVEIYSGDRIRVGLMHLKDLKCIEWKDCLISGRLLRANANAYLMTRQLFEVMASLNGYEIDNLWRNEWVPPIYGLEVFEPEDEQKMNKEDICSLLNNKTKAVNESLMFNGTYDEKLGEWDGEEPGELGFLRKNKVYIWSFVVLTVLVCILLVTGPVRDYMLGILSR
jgi:hypothetical protein